LNKILKAVLFIALFLGFLSTVSYCSAPFDTETAQTISIRKTINGEGYILRCETPVEQSTRGVFELGVKDGVRVAKGSSIGVAISGNYNDELVKKLSEVTARIEEIEKSDSFSDIYASDEARIFSALKDFTSDIRQSSYMGDYASAAENTKQLSTLLEKKFSKENLGAAEALLVSLEEEKYELEQRLGGIREEVKAAASGYFYSSLDGLESRAEEKELFALTPSQIGKFASELQEYEPQPMYVGKVVDTYAWYLAAVIDSEEAAALKTGSHIKLSVDEAPSVQATVEAINTDEAGRSAIIIKSTRDVRGIFEKRTASFEICYEEYDGLYVPSAAIRVVNGVTGVYVISRNESVSFRAVDILLKEEDFYIVKSNYSPPAEVIYPSLRLYDNILVNPEAVKIHEPEK